MGIVLKNILDQTLVIHAINTKTYKVDLHKTKMFLHEKGVERKPEEWKNNLD